MRTFKRIVGVLLIFVFGVFVGAALTMGGAVERARETLMGGAEAVMDVVVKRLDRELKLDAEQKRKLLGIVDDARIRLRQSQAKIQPEVEQTLHDAEERTRAILYPQQIKKFDDMVARSREKWKKNRAGTPAPPEVTPATATPSPIQATPAPATPAAATDSPARTSVPEDGK